MQGSAARGALYILNLKTTMFTVVPCVHLDIIKFFYLPTDAQENCFKKNIKIYIKTAPPCFRAITIIRERITVFARVICVLFFLFWPLKNRGA
jgi:hypothetical protein